MNMQKKPDEYIEKQQSPLFEVQLPFLQHLKKVMIPHEKQFNIIDFFQLIIDYCIKLPNQTFQSSIIQQLSQNQSLLQQSSESVPEIQLPTLSPKRSDLTNKIKQSTISVQIKQKKIKYAQQILDKLKNIFLWYRKKSISYQMINNYVLSCQNRTLKYKNSLQNLSQYQNLPQRRIRLDQNVKLCIMPQGDSGKIKFLSINPIQQNRQDIFRKQIFVVTSQYIRSIHVDSQKLAKQGNKTMKIHQLQHLYSNKISIVKNWYTYSQQKVIPQNKSNNQKDMKINAKKQLYIDKVAISQHLIGIITHEKEVLIKPFLNNQQKFQRGRRIIPYQIRLGNLVYDIPDQNLQKPISKDKVKAQQMQKSKVLLFQCYNDDIWIAVNQSFVYVYILPLPDSNQYVNDEQPKSSLLALCQPLPSKAYQAKLLTKQYLAIMLQTPCVIILKLQLSSKKQLRQKNRIYPTNKIYNDIKFICMNYHSVDKQLIFTDFGSYLVRLKFNIKDGDIQRQGAVYDQQTGKFLTQNTTNTKRDKQFSILKKQSQINIQQSLMNHFTKQELNKMTLEQKNNTKTKIKQIQKNKKQTLTIWQNKGTSIAQISVSQINLGNHKKQHKNKNNKQQKDRSGMSIYSKPQNTDYMTIVKNNSRQNMILLCLNKNSSTLITYQQMSVNPLKNGKEDEQSDKDRLYNKTIKLWDINYMNVYQTFTLSLQIVDLSLQSNGLYIVTKERGYLGFYPLLNKEQSNQLVSSSNTNQIKAIKKQQIKKARSILGQKIILSGNEIFFCTQIQKEKNYNKIQKQGYQNHLVNYNNSVTTIYSISLTNNQHLISNLQQIPSQINKLQVKEKLYVLSDTSGDKRYNLHIYDKLGNKQGLLKGTRRTQKYGILQNYTNIRRINHFQFNILMWNKHSLKFIGSNLQQSLTIHWTLNCSNKSATKPNQSQYDIRSLKSSISRKQKSIQDIYINENSISIQQKLQNDIFKSVTLSIYHLQSGRIKYRINDIRSCFKLLEMFNNILLVHQSVYTKSKTSNQAEQLQIDRKSSLKFNKLQNNNSSSNYQSSTLNSSYSSYPIHQNQQLINVIDFNSPFNKKCSFTLKFNHLTQNSMTINQIQHYQMNFNNAILYDKFFTQKHISLKSARLFTLNNDDSLIISCIFHIKHQLIFKNAKHNATTSTKVFRQSNKYILYTREISTQISNKTNYIPRTSDANIKKVNKKVTFQYMGQAQIHERILGHWQIDLQQLITRSTIKNYNYMNDLHSDTDVGVNFIHHDITQKLLLFNSSDKSNKTQLQLNQNILQLYQTNHQHQSNQLINIQWILAQSQSSKSIISINSSQFFELYSLDLSAQINYINNDFSINNYKQLPILHTNLQKICHVLIDQQTDKPIINQWNQNFNSQNKNIWEQTKSQMLSYIKHKLSKQTQKLLNSPSNLNKNTLNSPTNLNKKISLQKKSSLITLQQSPTIHQHQQYQNKQESQNPISDQNIQKPEAKSQSKQQQSLITKQSSSQQKQSLQKHSLKSHFNSNQINNMFRQWHINKNIQKQMKQYQNNSNKAQKQLNKQIKQIIQIPQLKQQRIKYLLNFPQKIKDPKIFNTLQKVSKNIQSPTNLSDIFLLIKQNQQKSKQLKPSQKKLKNTNDQSLQKRIQMSLQKIQSVFSLPKITIQQKTIKSKSSFGTSKLSQLKDTKKQIKYSKIQSSFINSQINQFSSPLKNDKNLHNSKYSNKIPLTRTKTQTSEKNYLQLIAQTPLESSAKLYKKGSIIQKNLKQNIFSPNPESSLSNIKVEYTPNLNPTLGTPGVTSVLIQKQTYPNSDKLQAKKSKSVMTRAKTQMSNNDDQILSNISKSALIQLDQSSKIITKSILPQIKINRQKLNQKMKQKKSFLKVINQRLCFSKQQVKQFYFKKQKKQHSQRQRLLTTQ